MYKSVNLVTFTIVVMLLISGCNVNSELDNLEINFFNEGSTYRTGEFHTYEVALLTGEEEPISVEDVYLYMNMERMNHPMEGTMVETEKGHYQLDLPLAMEGEWYAEVTVKIGDEEKTERFLINGEGEMVMDFMKGYNADN
ncbi:FixH family protein [Bacillus shivajii]|uniref:FixH family protein n=1 Tax=Bacillus shivajii TaxID=1983719 RepID=UPI001CFB8B68|nr:FixH family protein [Bacillus shivajii]UCZ52036.1 FixH family protein [Bacillus shivajii]